AVAAEVARLLALGARGEARLGAEPLGGGDVAVLVRTNDEGRRVREALTACGVASVQQAVDSVFHAPAAVEVERVLLAVAEPASAARARGARDDPPRGERRGAPPARGGRGGVGTANRGVPALARARTHARLRAH